LLYDVEETEDTTEPLIFFDTQGGEFPEKSEEEQVDKKAGKGMMGESKSNEMEATLVKQHVGNLVSAGVKPEDIAVVTPYNAQVRYTPPSQALLVQLLLLCIDIVLCHLANSNSLL
jgi:DNA polymerase alpha-associated DNA helicase A